jgi:hypothetical protein
MNYLDPFNYFEPFDREMRCRADAGAFCKEDGLYRNSGLPEFRVIASRKSGKPDLRCQARQ